MAKKKHYFYVLVFTSEGPRYVTKVDNVNRVSHWEVDDKPLEFTRENADDMARGLTWNGNHAVVVQSLWEIENHPYNYAGYDCTFVKKEDKDDVNA